MTDVSHSRAWVYFQPHSLSVYSIFLTTHPHTHTARSPRLQASNLRGNVLLHDVTSMRAIPFSFLSIYLSPLHESNLLPFSYDWYSHFPALHIAIRAILIVMRFLGNANVCKGRNKSGPSSCIQIRVPICSNCSSYHQDLVIQHKPFLLITFYIPSQKLLVLPMHASFLQFDPAMFACSPHWLSTPADAAICDHVSVMLLVQRHLLICFPYQTSRFLISSDCTPSVSIPDRELMYDSCTVHA